MAKQTQESIEFEISEEMLKNCKKDISYFGFENEKYEDFLISVKAINKEKEVIELPVLQIEQYREKYTKKHESAKGSIHDPFIFDQISKISYTDESGQKVFTGYFCPRKFWDYVRNKKIYSTLKTKEYPKVDMSKFKPSFL